MTIHIKAIQKKGFWRCGVFHTSDGATFAANHFSPKELERLKAEALLKVTSENLETESQGQKAKAGTKAKAKAAAETKAKAKAEAETKAKAKAETKAGNKTPDGGFLGASNQTGT